MKLNEWLSYRQTCLDELLRHDGLGSSIGQKECWTCKGSGNACWKCLDCNDGGWLRCQECIITVHSSHALHRIEVWQLLCIEQILIFILRNGMVLFLRNHLFMIQAFAFSMDMGVQSALLQCQDPSHSLWLMFQGFIRLRLTSVIVAQMVSFLITSNFYELVGFLPLSFAPKQPSHFTVSISTMS